MKEEPRRYSKFPKELSRCVEQLTRPVFKTKGVAAVKLMTDWPSIVGDRLARRSMPEKITFPHGKKTDGTLTIIVENGFAPEIQHMQLLILEKLATYYGYRAVIRIAIGHSYKKPEPAKPAPKNRAPSLPTEAVKLTDTVEDAELKSALTSFAETLSNQS